jgi:hypothetical protein
MSESPQRLGTDDLERQVIHPSPMAGLFVLLHSPGDGESGTRARLASRILRQTPSNPLRHPCRKASQHA